MFRILKIRRLTRGFLISLFLLSGIGLCSEVYFSPDGGTRDQVIKRINLSKSTIDIAVYSFTSAEIADALASASKRGVKVRIIRDRTQSSNKSDENNFLTKNAVQIQIRPGKGRGIMHHKFAIFDHKEAFTGSYNWTDNAEQNNFENALFTEEKDVVDSYEKEFLRIWNLPLTSRHR